MAAGEAAQAVTAAGNGWGRLRAALFAPRGKLQAERGLDLIGGEALRQRLDHGALGQPAQPGFAVVAQPFDVAFLRHERATAAVRLDHAGLLQLPIGARRGAWVHTKLLGQLAHRRQSFARPQFSARHR